MKTATVTSGYNEYYRMTSGSTKNQKIFSGDKVEIIKINSEMAEVRKGNWSTYIPTVYLR